MIISVIKHFYTRFLPLTFTPHCLRLSEDTVSRWSLLSGVYARESKKSHTGGKYVTCHGLHILEDNSEINHSCVSPRMGYLRGVGPELSSFLREYTAYTGREGGGKGPPYAFEKCHLWSIAIL